MPHDLEEFTAKISAQKSRLSLMESVASETRVFEAKLIDLGAPVQVDVSNAGLLIDIRFEDTLALPGPEPTAVSETTEQAPEASAEPDVQEAAPAATEDPGSQPEKQPGGSTKAKPGHYVTGPLSAGEKAQLLDMYNRDIPAGHIASALGRDPRGFYHKVKATLSERDAKKRKAAAEKRDKGKPKAQPAPANIEPQAAEEQPKAVDTQQEEPEAQPTEANGPRGTSEETAEADALAELDDSDDSAPNSDGSDLSRSHGEEVARLRALPKMPGWTPQRDLDLATLIFRGASFKAAAAALKTAEDRVRERWWQLHRDRTPDGQERLHRALKEIAETEAG